MKQQFDLSLWLKDKSRKVVTRGGRPVRIVCWDANNPKPIVALVLTRSISQRQFDELTISYFNDGTYYGGAKEDSLDLFFADEEEELTEFEKELRYWIGQSLCNYENNGCVSDNMSDSVNIYLKTASKKLLDLARKEIFKEQEHCVIISEDYYYEQLASQYQKGHKDALKDLPKWKKVDSNPPKVQYNLQGKRLYKDGEYYIELSDLEALPKEE